MSSVRVAIGRANFKHQNRTNLLQRFIWLDIGNVVDENDVEITTKESNDIFKDTIDDNEPDPAIVDSKKRKNPSIIDWPGLEDGRIATARISQNGRKAWQNESAQLNIYIIIWKQFCTYLTPGWLMIMSQHWPRNSKIVWK